MRRIVEMLSSVTGFPIDDNDDGLPRGCTSQEVRLDSEASMQYLLGEV